MPPHTRFSFSSKLDSMRALKQEHKQSKTNRAVHKQGGEGRGEAQHPTNSSEGQGLPMPTVLFQLNFSAVAQSCLPSACCTRSEVRQQMRSCDNGLVILLQLCQPFMAPKCPNLQGQAGANPGLCSAEMTITSSKQSPPEELCSPGHKIKQQGKISVPGENHVPQQPRAENCAQQGCSMAMAGLQPLICQLLYWGRGADSQGAQEGTGTAIGSNGENLHIMKHGKTVREETLWVCTEVHPALAVELFK